mgnify:CR=1 FL=1
MLNKSLIRFLLYSCYYNISRVFGKEVFTIIIFVRSIQKMYSIFKQLLQTKGVSTYKVSKETGVSQQTFSSWKNGISTPKVDKLQKIANYFGVSLEYLMGKDTETTTEDIELQSYLEELRTRPEMKMLFSLTKKATKADVEKAIKIIEVILEK